MSQISAIKVSAILVSSALLACNAAPANAQIWIGQIVGDMAAQAEAARLESLCMSGTPMPDKEIEETRESAYATMQGYWQAVSAGQETDISSFYKNSKKIRWNSGESRIAKAAPVSITDPFANNGAALDAQPIDYFRSGDGSTLGGRWRVKNADGSLIGTYDVEMRRVLDKWKLSELTLTPANEFVEPLVQYCHKRGDVLPHRLKTTEQVKAYTEKRAAKMAAKADKAELKAKKAEAKAETSNSSRAEEMAKLRRDKATRAAEKADEAEQKKQEAIAAFDKARADKAAWDKKLADLKAAFSKKHAGAQSSPADKANTAS